MWWGGCGTGSAGWWCGRCEGRAHCVNNRRRERCGRHESSGGGGMDGWGEEIVIGEGGCEKVVSVLKVVRVRA